MSSTSLSARLKALTRRHNETLALIQKLQNTTPAPTADSNSRSELASEIHQNLRDQEDALEVLRQDIDEAPSPSGRPWVGGGSVTKQRESEHDAERGRDATTIARLSEDLKIAHQAFRKAQLQSKRNADVARRKERELLFKHADTENRPGSRRAGQESLTQDELAINAADNVTRTLRRAHDLLQGNLQQSQFAQETLQQSSAALEGLTDSYSGMDGLLKSSKGLVGQLLRSQKSDTWYLETAFWILCLTIGWLVFRRWLYGPGWWLIYQPLKILWYGFGMVLSSIGIFGGGKEGASSMSSSISLAPGLNAQGRPTFQPGGPRISMELPVKGGGWNRKRQPSKAAEEGMIEKIGKIVDGGGEDATQEELGVQDNPEGDEEKQDEQPRNPKKRMMELEKEQAKLKDEL